MVELSHMSWSPLYHPRRVLIIFIIGLLPLLSFFVLYPVDLETDVRRGFAHKNGRSQMEFQRFAEHFGLSYKGLELWVVLITAKGGDQNHLRVNQSILDEVYRLDEHLRNFTMTNDRGEIIHSSEFFGDDINYLFKWYRQMYSLSSLSSSINLTFPVARIFEHKLFLGSHFFGVNENGTKENAPIETARTIGLWYVSNGPGKEKRKHLEDVEMDAFRLALNDSFSDIISFEMFADQVANAEMFRGTVETRFLFLIGIALMVLFMMFTFRHLTWRSMTCAIIAGIASPALATAVTFAILGWTGASLNSIMCITPFLVVAIGVDDGFLLIHAWRRHRRLVRPSTSRSSDSRDTVTASIAKAVLLEVAPSMAITSATNTMAFGVGIFSPTIQMSDFCLATAMAILLDFFFEFLVFLPVIAISYEEKEKQSVQSYGGRSMWEWHTSLLLSTTGKAVVATILLAVYTSSFIGLMTLKTGFDPSKAFPSDSRLVSSLAAFDKIHKEYAPLNLVTSSPPQLDDKVAVERYREMVHRLETRPECQPEHTQHPLLDFIKWEEGKPVPNSTYERLPEYLREKLMSELKIVRYNDDNGTITVEGVNFYIVCKGLEDWTSRARSIDELRRLLDEYPEFDTTVFDYDGTIYDIVISVKEEVIKAVAITFCCMAVACGFFIPSLIGASAAAFSMLSITFTMLGTLSHWGATLDPVTMINILLAVGFSVDFSAHICYHFHKCRRIPSTKSRVHRMSEILEAVGKPIFEASLSTFICVVPLFALKIYVFNSFAKTVTLVAIFGLFHGLVVVPVLLSMFLPRATRGSMDIQDERVIEDDHEKDRNGMERTRLPLLKQ